MKKNKCVTTEAMHRGGYSKNYYDIVNSRLKEVDNIIKDKGYDKIMGKMLIAEELKNIKKDLLNGVLQVSN